MPISTPTSISRYRPAILVLTGAAAAYTAYLVYNSFQPAPAEGLHRSNAVRRPNSRARPRQSHTAHIIQRLQQDAHVLGEFDFFGTPIVLDPRHLITIDELHEIAHQARPDTSPEQVNHTIGQLIDTFLDRLLAYTFPLRPLSPAESSAVMLWIAPQIPDDRALSQAMQRHANSFPSEETMTVGVAESVVGTELSDESDDDGIDPDGQTLQRTLYHIAEDRARHEGVIHRGITCNGCDDKPIRGIRWRCANCPDFDLCSNCEATNSHTKTHIFYKIRVPAPYSNLPKQEPIYPGKPGNMSPSINSSLKKRLVSETKMEAEEIEALWDQFTCLAGSEWEADPNHIGWALDRRAFNHAFVPRYASFVAAPNLIYDRIFAFYDTDRNGLIGFEEWIKGLDGMHTNDPAVKCRIVFNGYDADGDGYISRRDVLRVFRAYYAIEKEATRNFLAESAEELSLHRAIDLVRSSQPLGSAFGQNGIPARNPDNPRLPQKTIDGGEDSSPVILENDLETADREEMLQSTDLRNILFSGLPQHQLDRIVADRWARRQFYIDEEEGLTQPEGVTETAADPESDERTPENFENPSSPENERPRWSRSSSRVRFQDDVDIETRSNASTSSRPVGERWGGYEIPEPEKDLGKEVLYQITQQAFNELLNPLFQEKEDNAMDAFDTRAERRKRVAEIEETLEEFKKEKDFNRAVVAVGIFRYSKCVANILWRILNGKGIKTLFEDENGSKFRPTTVQYKLQWLFGVAEQAVLKSTKDWNDDWVPEGMPMWNAKLCRTQLEQEFINGVMTIGYKLGWLLIPRRESPDPEADDQPNAQGPSYDPTMPQFRPNSLADIEAAAVSSGSSRTVVDQFQAASELSSDQNASDTSSVRIESLQEDADDLAYYYDSAFPGPHFLLSSQEMNTMDAEKQEKPHEEEASQHNKDEDPSDSAQSPSTASDPLVESIASIPLPPSSPSPESTEYPTLPRIPIYTVTNNRVIHLMWFNTETKAFHCDARDVRFPDSPFEPEMSPQRPIERKIRKAAMCLNSPLHLTMLASLETVEKEISERKGSGLLSFEEFEEHMQQGRLRFLESWMDWVSF